jgi:hypothetical protein
MERTPPILFIYRIAPGIPGRSSWTLPDKSCPFAPCDNPEPRSVPCPSPSESCDDLLWSRRSGPTASWRNFYPVISIYSGFVVVGLATDVAACVFAYGDARYTLPLLTTIFVSGGTVCFGSTMETPSSDNL